MSTFEEHATIHCYGKCLIKVHIEENNTTEKKTRKINEKKKLTLSSEVLFP